MYESDMVTMLAKENGECIIVDTWSEDYEAPSIDP